MEQVLAMSRLAFAGPGGIKAGLQDVGNARKPRDPADGGPRQIEMLQRHRDGPDSGFVTPGRWMMPSHAAQWRARPIAGVAEFELDCLAALKPARDLGARPASGIQPKVARLADARTPARPPRTDGLMIAQPVLAKAILHVLIFRPPREAFRVVFPEPGGPGEGVEPRQQRGDPCQ